MIKTPRLLLEPISVAHSTEMYHGLIDTALYEFIDDEPPISIDSLKSRYARLEKHVSPEGSDGRERPLNWILRERGDSGRCIGYVQATVKPGKTASLAYVLFRQCWGVGYALEAVGATIIHLHRRRGVNYFHALTDRRNTRSINLLSKLCFRKTASQHSIPAPELLIIDESEYVFEV